MKKIYQKLLLVFSLAVLCSLVSTGNAKADSYGSTTIGSSKETATELVDDGSKMYVAPITAEDKEGWFKFTVKSSTAFYSIIGKNISLDQLVEMHIYTEVDEQLEYFRLHKGSEDSYQRKFSAGDTIYIMVDNRNEVSGNIGITFYSKEDNGSDEMSKAQDYTIGTKVTSSWDGDDDEDWYTIQPSVSGKYEFYLKNLTMDCGHSGQLVSTTGEVLDSETYYTSGGTWNFAYDLTGGDTYYFVSKSGARTNNTLKTGNYDFYVKPLSILKAKPKGVKIKNYGSSGMKITWKKTSTATGYEVQYSKDKKFSNPSNRDIFSGENHYEVTYLSSVTYYVRVRPYRKIETQKYYGKYSKAVKIKIK